MQATRTFLVKFEAPPGQLLDAADELEWLLYGLADRPASSVVRTVLLALDDALTDEPSAGAERPGPEPSPAAAREADSTALVGFDGDLDDALASISSQAASMRLRLERGELDVPQLLRVLAEIAASSARAAKWARELHGDEGARRVVEPQV